MDKFLLPLFVINLLLTLTDAAVGYHAAPALMRHFTPDEVTAEHSTAGMRGMLGLVVALYMFFNCYGYYRGSGVILLVVTGVILADMVAQIALRKRADRRGGE
ncbi:hypothetical protein KIP69_15125 [Geobacter sulfurreducens]|jgi:hypothetical protein|uniref:DUF5658 domain-containing protein n=1 Tax=Geobacter sulfurreducens (strain ATCC 51573 / DSM 12127 / PCA) TaxID=243231 RepID=Q748A5_GEOSL|nr:hypothetical protein [Geobacter sulfurreducens]AAR36501.1 hypothetical protein GSU3110 [Geobacter sulfurreducens PCA]ADI85861.1 hypothetical protein KN400_3049 [Geobacter sulfurreducens KN400]AJY69349.1 hypothetical protein RW64_06865 [Geobacter sulfurreducens]QVW34904.1 hypothetical protein KIP69_15125 [Geobacter sulfurreducens]UAC03775.1 hypothetical protein KVP06_15635 [Geobacter sulfurreducens]